MPKLDPDDLRRFAQRRWVPTLAEDRRRRARQPVASKVATAIMLYEAAKATRPDWPTVEDRRADLTHHLRLIALIRRAPDVGTR